MGELAVELRLQCQAWVEAQHQCQACEDNLSWNRCRGLIASHACTGSRCHLAKSREATCLALVVYVISCGQASRVSDGGLIRSRAYDMLAARQTIPPIRVFSRKS